MDLQYKSVVNFPPSKVTETSRKGIEVLEMENIYNQLNVTFFDNVMQIAKILF